MIMAAKTRYYEGKFLTDYEAARQYDKYSLLLNGPGARTSFSYTKAEVRELVEEDVDMTDLKRLR